MLHIDCDNDKPYNIFISNETISENNIIFRKNVIDCSTNCSNNKNTGSFNMC